MECRQSEVQAKSEIDLVLRTRGMKRVVAYPFIVGDCLFDSVSYVLGGDSRRLRRDMINHFKSLMRNGDSKALEWQNNFLTLENLRDLHQQEFKRYMGSSEDLASEYMSRMQLSAAEGGLWGDHFCVYWLQELLKRPIRIWLAETGRAVGGQAEELTPDEEERVIQLVYHSSKGIYGLAHYEPLVPLGTHVEDEQVPTLRLHQCHDKEHLQTIRSVRRRLRRPLPPDEELRHQLHEGHDDEQAHKKQPPVQEDDTLLKDEPQALRSFSTENMQMQVKKDPYQKAIEAAIERARAGGGEPKRPEATEAQQRGGLLTNFEVLDLLRRRGFGGAANCITKSELKVYEYLVQTPAATQSRQSLEECSQDSLIARLTRHELIQIANLRPVSPVEIHLIVEDIQKRFSDEEVDGLIASINRFLPKTPQRPEAEQDAVQA